MTNPALLAELRAFAAECLRPPPIETVSQWCERNIFLPSPQTQVEGFIRFDGREYLREFIDGFGSPRVTDEVACFGSQTGKTTGIICGTAWTILNDPSGVLWVMPNMDLARSFAETRWIPILRASPQLARLIPSGAKRHAFKTGQQQIGSAIINFVGSNSPANLASRPARRVILDEVDKFSEGGKGEADAVNLAEQRAKSFANAQRIKVSTPTVLGSLIWTEYLKGDQRRYFVPCVHCGKHLLLAWSKAFTVMRLTGNEAFITWDKSAKREGGQWDLDRVERSARAVCPHCHLDILDGMKTRMLRAGEWRATAQGPSGFRSRQLSSLYAATPETTWGKMAVKFLQAKRSILGLQGFINGDLAEPYAAQDTAGERIEVITKRAVADLVTGKDWHRVMTVDCQQLAPHFWYVIRAWSLTGDSEGIASGYCAEWSDVRKLQLEYQVPDCGVMVDSGFGALSDDGVYQNCARYSEAAGSLLVGWTPAKGMPGRTRWKDGKTGKQMPYTVSCVDPYRDTSMGGIAKMNLIEFSADYFKDVLTDLRAGKTSHKWQVNEACGSEEYWRHLDSKVKRTVINKRNGRETLEWQKRSHRWPDHLDDCEVMQVVMASLLKMFELKS